MFNFVPVSEGEGSVRLIIAKQDDRNYAGKNLISMLYWMEEWMDLKFLIMLEY